MAHGSDGALMTALTQLCTGVLRTTTTLPKTPATRKPSIALVRASTSAAIAFDQSRRHEHGTARVRLVVRAAKDVAEVSAWLSHVAALEETLDPVHIATLLAEAESILAALALRLVGEPEAASLAA